MRADTEAILKQFEAIEALYPQLRKPVHGVGGINISYAEESSARQFYTLCISCIERIAGPSSVYRSQAEKAISPNRNQQLESCEGLYGVIQGLKYDVEQGYLTTLRELIHADLFSDLLESADYFLSEGHKDPAAVMIGGVLEQHLRQLCQKSGLPTEILDSRDASKMTPKKADTMNAELAKASVYGKLEQKQITAWLDLRNQAAHGHFENYDVNQVKSFLGGVRDFIIKYPA